MAMEPNINVKHGDLPFLAFSSSSSQSVIKYVNEKEFDGVSNTVRTVPSPESSSSSSDPESSEASEANSLSSSEDSSASSESSNSNSLADSD